MTAPLHPWTLSPREALRLQQALRPKLRLDWDDRPITSVGGVDVSVAGDAARAAVVVLRYPDLTLLDSAVASVPLAFPYIPGLLSFREGPAALAAWAALTNKPGLVMFDGHGIAHPRGIGLASHLGLWLNCPAIGVAKSRLYGHHEMPGPARGDCAPLQDEENPNRIIGAVLRTRKDVRPLYVSPGHQIDVGASVRFVLSCCTNYRLPEPTRWAHHVAGGIRLPGASVASPGLL